MRYRVDRTVDQPVHNGIEYYKYFANTQIAYVDSVRCNYDSNKYMYAFLRSYDGLTSYLLVTDYALITYK